MKIDFFDKKYNPTTTTEPLFYIADEQLEQPAYVKNVKFDYSVAEVRNRERKSVIFTAIDKNVDIAPSQGRRCDGMITFDSAIFFIELKDQKEGWKTAAFEQLKNTIHIFSENHNVLDFGKKRAYACNIRHPRFQKFAHEDIAKFRKENYGFIPFSEATITI